MKELYRNLGLLGVVFGATAFGVVMFLLVFGPPVLVGLGIAIWLRGD
jgi:hypothetical protein